MYSTHQMNRICDAKS